MITIRRSKLQGKVIAPPSKSVAHRAIICASMASGKSVVRNVDFSEDILATIDVMRAFGAEIECGEREVYINNGIDLFLHGENQLVPNDRVEPIIANCRESGTTLRMTIPLAMIINGGAKFVGKGRLMARPLDAYTELFDECGVRYAKDDDYFYVGNHGALRQTIRISGKVSSQYISGLLCYLPNLPEIEGGYCIEIIDGLESRAYIDLTINVLKNFGISVKNFDYKRFVVQGGQKFIAREYEVENDFSQAAFWLVARELGNDIEVEGLSVKSLQGDRRIVQILDDMFGVHEDNVKYIIDAREIPDLVPILAVAGCFVNREVDIINAERLRYKESDRLFAIATELNNLGAKIEERDDGLLIKPIKKLSGGRVSSHNDHRIAMAIAIASTMCEGAIELEGEDSVRKSYPRFWQEFKRLGGKIETKNE
ncbi:MAG: 3-phosphoshikimate 1-carboxyvinyltransferase [Clostridiales bacterium]|jgi:3-phosphoshikimate 1-carboxyvinyltransferase|nr:3-phosphoshikimate 1-carboxyvinyltransferase [Clostridiales bacterium]